MPHVLDAVFHHHQAVDAAAKGKTGVFIRIDVSSFQHIRMDHTAAQQFNPAFARANLTIWILTFTKRTAQRKFKARFGEREVKWIDAHVKFLAVIFLQKLLQCGDEITDIVKDVSEPKTAGQPKLPWKERKESYLKHLGNSYYIEAYIVATADKIHNLTDILKDYDQFGDETWQRFNASKWDILQYYRAVFNLIRNEPVPIELKRHLATLIEELAGVVMNH